MKCGVSWWCGGVRLLLCTAARPARPSAPPQLSERPRRRLLPPAAAHPQHMLSYARHDNFGGLAVAAEVIALRGREEKKTKRTIASLRYAASILTSHVIGDSSSLCIAH